MAKKKSQNNVKLSKQNYQKLIKEFDEENKYTHKTNYKQNEIDALKITNDLLKDAYQSLLLDLEKQKELIVTNQTISSNTIAQYAITNNQLQKDLTHLKQQYHEAINLWTIEQTKNKTATALIQLLEPENFKLKCALNRIPKFIKTIFKCNIV